MIGFGKYGKKTELEIKSLNDERLILIDPSFEGFFDTVLDFYPDSKFDSDIINIRNFKEAVKDVKGVELIPFWRPVMDPSMEGENVVYKEGNEPATGYSFNWWCQKATEMPTVDGKTWKVSTEYQYYAFLVWLINKLVESRSMSVKKAIEAVVLDSFELGYYCNSRNVKVKGYFEPTGSREVCGVYDLANNFKIIDCSNTEAGGFWLAGGNFLKLGHFYPLARLEHYNYVDRCNDNSVGLLVLS